MPVLGWLSAAPSLCPSFLFSLRKAPRPRGGGALIKSQPFSWFRLPARRFLSLAVVKHSPAWGSLSLRHQEGQIKSDGTPLLGAVAVAGAGAGAAPQGNMGSSLATAGPSSQRRSLCCVRVRGRHQRGGGRPQPSPPQAASEWDFPLLLAPPVALSRSLSQGSQTHNSARRVRRRREAQGARQLCSLTEYWGWVSSITRQKDTRAGWNQWQPAPYHVKWQNWIQRFSPLPPPPLSTLKLWEAGRGGAKVVGPPVSEWSGEGPIRGQRRTSGSLLVSSLSGCDSWVGQRSKAAGGWEANQVSEGRGEMEGGLGNRKVCRRRAERYGHGVAQVDLIRSELPWTQEFFVLAQSAFGCSPKALPTARAEAVRKARIKLSAVIVFCSEVNLSSVGRLPKKSLSCRRVIRSYQPL